MRRRGKRRTSTTPASGSLSRSSLTNTTFSPRTSSKRGPAPVAGGSSKARGCLRDAASLLPHHYKLVGLPADSIFYLLSSRDMIEVCPPVSW